MQWWGVLLIDKIMSCTLLGLFVPIWARMRPLYAWPSSFRVFSSHPEFPFVIVLDIQGFGGFSIFQKLACSDCQERALPSILTGGLLALKCWTTRFSKRHWRWYSVFSLNSRILQVARLTVSLSNVAKRSSILAFVICVLLRLRRRLIGTLAAMIRTILDNWNVHDQYIKPVDSTLIYKILPIYCNALAASSHWLSWR